MAELEPVSEILKKANLEANNILKTAKAKADDVLRQANQDADLSLKAMTQNIQTQTESKFSAEYSRKKIWHNKKMQDVMSSKLDKIKSEAINDLVSDKAYPSVMTLMLDNVMANYKNVKVRASADFDIVQKKYPAVKDEQVYHGFFIDVGNKIIDYSIEHIVDKYLSDHPIKLI